MLHEIFYWVLNMSIIASIDGILLYLLRYIKGFPKRGSYALWGVVLIRLLCPVGITSNYSLLNILSKVTRNVYVRTIPIYNANKGIITPPKLVYSNTIQSAITYQPITYKTNRLEQFFTIASNIWITVFIVFILAFLIMYLLTVSELKKAKHLNDHIYYSSMVDTPIVYGFLQPKIVLPAAIVNQYTYDELKYILSHEQVHIKRFDNIWRVFAIVAACIHWFNPFIWIYLKHFLTDCELACDEAVISKLDADERKQYAQTLVTYAAKNQTFFATAFTSSKIKARVKHVINYRKLTLLSSFFCIGFILWAAYILLTNAKV